MHQYSFLNAPESSGRDDGRRPPTGVPHATPHTGIAMHPADLAEHRARRERSALRSLERQAANLAPRVPAGERLALHILCDAARQGAITAADASPLIRARISQLDREHTQAA